MSFRSLAFLFCPSESASPQELGVSLGEAVTSGGRGSCTTRMVPPGLDRARKGVLCQVPLMRVGAAQGNWGMDAPLCEVPRGVLGQQPLMRVTLAPRVPSRARGGRG